MAQMIAFLMGQNRIGLLSDVSKIVSEHRGNIVDSRIAVFGSDITITLLIECEEHEIGVVELEINLFAQANHMMSLLKRTANQHQQEMVNQFNIMIAGLDKPGVIATLTRFLADHHVNINVFRQQSFEEKNTGAAMLKANVLINLPRDLPLEKLEQGLNLIMDELDLIGHIDAVVQS